MKTAHQIYYRFYKQPFVLLTVLLAVGILLSSLFAQSDIIMFSCLLVSLVFMVLVYFGRLNSSYFFVGLIPVFLLLGMYLYQEKSGSRELARFSSNYSQNDGLIGEIRELRSGQGEWSRVIFNVKQIVKRNESLSASAQLLVYLKNNTIPLEEGDIILVSGELQAITNRNNPGEFDAQKHWNNKGIHHMLFIEDRNFFLVDKAQPSLINKWVRGTRRYLNTVIEHYFPAVHQAVLKAIVLGDKSKLDHETRATFGNSGAMHLLAVSGLHVGIFLAILLFIFQFTSRYLSKVTALAVILFILWFYALITGFSPSVFRAVFMFTVFVVAQMLSRNYDPINVLFLSAFVVLVFAPQQLFDIGFQLSYAAMLGIFLYYAKIESFISTRNWVLKKAWQGTAIGLSAQLMTIPLTLIYFHQFPNYFVLTNLGLLVFSGVLLGLALVLFVVHFIPLINQLIAFCLFVVLFLLLEFLGFVEGLPMSVAVGFDLNWIQLVVLIGLPFILLLKQKTKLESWLYSVVLIGAMSWMTYDRFQRMNNSEVVVFNHKAFVLLAKSGNSAICVYDKARADLEKVENLVLDYTKVNPTNVEFIPIDQEEIQVGWKAHELRIAKSDGGFWIDKDDSKYYVSKSIRTIDMNQDVYVIGMPWIKAGVHYCLEEGAIRL